MQVKKYSKNHENENVSKNVSKIKKVPWLQVEGLFEVFQTIEENPL